jgi:hypothetical protein
MNNELERIWRNVVMAYFNVQHCHLPGGTEVTYAKPQSDTWSQVDLNSGPPN